MKTDEEALVVTLVTIAEELLLMHDAGIPFPRNSPARREAERAIAEVKFRVVRSMRPWQPPDGKTSPVSAPLIN
jgi:hypothetical protein